MHLKPARLLLALLLGLYAESASARAEPPPIPPIVEPPARAGRIAQIVGAVSFHAAQADHWEPAILNFPITSGDVLWTEPQARAAIDVAGNRLSMDQSTQLDVATLDDHALVATQAQGELYLRLPQVPPGDSYTVQTPRGDVRITAAGRYGIVAGDSLHPTTVSVIEGEAQVTGPSLELQVAAGQTATITGDSPSATPGAAPAVTPLSGSIGPLQTDPFLAAALAGEQPRRPPTAAPPEIAQMTGAQDLQEYGAWQQSPEYGAVWYPQVEAGWVPYRNGRWSYVGPWGWSWVEEAPWGFAPFHYGRWFEQAGRWGWLPGGGPGFPGFAPGYRPIYAPALVGFVGFGPGFGPRFGFGLGFGAGPLGRGWVGWVPLGPREPYYPPYRARLDYVRDLNRGAVINVNQVIVANRINTVTVNDNHGVVQNFINRGGTTLVPAATMTGSQSVARAWRPLLPGQLAQLRPQARPPVSPAAGTVGVTPAVARQFGFAPAERAAAPGPAFQHAATQPAMPARQLEPGPATRNAQPPRPTPQFDQPGLNQPQLNQPQLNRPQFNRPDISRPQLSRPELHRPEPSRQQFSPPTTRPQPQQRFNPPPRPAQPIPMLQRPTVPRGQPRFVPPRAAPPPQRAAPQRAAPPRPAPHPMPQQRMPRH